MKKILAILVALTMFLVVIAPDTADARRGGGGFKSSPKTYNSNPKKSDNVQQSTNKSNTAGTTGANQNRGFFSGGGLMKGLMIGGLAGMLFGGMFAGMGMMGNLFGLIINLLAVWVLIMVVMAVVRTVKNRRRQNDRRDDRY